MDVLEKQLWVVSETLYRGTGLVTRLFFLNARSPELTVDLPSLQEDLSDILSTAADLSNKFTAKVIGYRSEQHAQLDLPSFLEFFNESWNFMVKCEVICRRMIVGLRGTILSQVSIRILDKIHVPDCVCLTCVLQAKLFLQTFHQSHINQSAKLVEDEQWNQIEVPASLQHLADVLVDSAVRDSPELIIRHSPSATTFPANGSSASVLPPSPQSARADLAPSGPSSKYIRIEDRPYFCVSATGAVLGLMLDYLRLVVNLSTLNTETMSRIIEFLKAFNSRTCQVVLGAGAMRSAGLKNITAKHLGQCSRALQFDLVLKCIHSSASIAITFHNGGPYPLHTGNISTAPRSKPGSDAG